jgi:hypothetical protein
VLPPGSMEVIRLTPNVGDGYEAPFDLARLAPDARALWDEYCSAPLQEGEGEVLRVWSFGQACMLTIDSGLPDVVIEYLRREDPNNLIGKYLETVAREHREGRR